jgi:2-keto-3-deoxy-6-phosphogluconate aldolase
MDVIIESLGFGLTTVKFFPAEQSGLAKDDLINARNFAGITALCAEAVAIAAEARNRGGK